MKALIYPRNGIKHQCYWCNAFMEGLKKHGIDAKVFNGELTDCDLLVAWGTRHNTIFAQQSARRGSDTICVLERGYLGDRFAWTSVGFGGKLNGYATFRGPFDDGSRLNLHFPDLLKPWKPHQQGYVLVLGQVPNDMSLRGINILSWYNTVIDQLRSKGYDCRFRQHPHGPSLKFKNASMIGGTLQQALDGCSFSLTFNSNSSVDAVINGTPCVTMDRGSMAWEVTGHDLEHPPIPDRQKWAERLAWCQWTEDEIRSGKCWDHVRPQ